MDEWQASEIVLTPPPMPLWDGDEIVLTPLWDGDGVLFEKFNEFHDELGRFSSGNSGGAGLPEYRVTSVSGRKGTYDPRYFTLQEDKLVADNGEVLGVKDILVPKDPRGWDAFRIPASKDPNVIFRGMSAGEYNQFAESGELKSRGGYNIGSQQSGLTYFSTDPESAAHYASGFAPSEFKATYAKPAYVVAVKRPALGDIVGVPGTGEDEVGVNRAISASDVVAVYRGRVVESDPGAVYPGGKTSPQSTLLWEKVGVKKYNEAHDELGRFAETGGGSYHETRYIGRDEPQGPPISAEQKQSVEQYTGGENSADINRLLRYGTKPVDKAGTLKDIATLDKLLDENRTTADTVVHRSIDRPMIKALDKAIAKNQGMFIDKGFVSTTRKERFAEDRDVAYVSIEIPKGSAALDVRPWSKKPEEDETLIARGQTFAARRDPNAANHFFVRLVPGTNKAHLLPMALTKAEKSDDRFTWHADDVVFLTTKYNPHHDEQGRFASGDGGGGEASAAQPFEYKVPPEVHAEDMRRTEKHIKALAEQYNFDPNLVHVSDAPKEFELNGKKYDYAGAAYLSGERKGQIDIWPEHVSPGDLGKIMAHEVMHQRFDDFLDTYIKESSAAGDESSKANWEPPNAPMLPSGSIREEFKDKYPLAYAVNEGGEWDLMNPKNLSENDGVTDYSRDWWKAWKDGTAQSSSAIHETLAELAYIGGGPREMSAPKLPEGFSYKPDDKGGFHVIRPNDEGYRFSVGWGQTKYEAARNAYVIGEDGKTRELMPELMNKPIPFQPFEQSKSGAKFPDKRWRKLYDLVNENWDRKHPK